MCIIAVSKSRHLTEEEFRNCYRNNPDGFGMSWSTGVDNRFKKGLMTYDESWKFYQNMIKKHGLKFPYVCHFRIKTEGAIIPELTHPFIISRKSPLNLKWKGDNSLLFHNGTISGWRRYLPKIESRFKEEIDEDKLSDSRALAMMLPTKGKNAIVAAGKYNKFAVFNKGRCKIFGDFNEENGIYFSNDGYKYTWGHYYDYSDDYYDDFYRDEYFPNKPFNRVLNDTDGASAGTSSNHIYRSVRYQPKVGFISDKDYQDIIDYSYVKCVDKDLFETQDIDYLEKELKLYKEIQDKLDDEYSWYRTQSVLIGAKIDTMVELVLKTQNILDDLRLKNIKNIKEIKNKN